MKKVLLSMVLVLGVGGYADKGAFAIENDITPYGDFFPGCCKYGMCKKELSDKESTSAIRSYFKKRGLQAGNPRGRGRFITVDVLRGGKVVDVVVFDRKTGRVRSTY